MIATDCNGRVTRSIEDNGVVATASTACSSVGSSCLLSNGPTAKHLVYLCQHRLTSAEVADLVVGPGDHSCEDEFPSQRLALLLRNRMRNFLCHQREFLFQQSSSTTRIPQRSSSQLLIALRSGRTSSSSFFYLFLVLLIAFGSLDFLLLHSWLGGNIRFQRIGENISREHARHGVAFMDPTVNAGPTHG